MGTTGSLYSFLLGTTTLKKEDGATQVDSLCYCMGAIQPKAIMKDFKYGIITIPNRNGENGTEEFQKVATDFDTVVKFTAYILFLKRISNTPKTGAVCQGQGYDTWRGTDVQKGDSRRIPQSTPNISENLRVSRC